VNNALKPLSATRIRDFRRLGFPILQPKRRGLFSLAMRPSRRQTQPFIRRWSAGRPSVTVLLIAMSLGAYASQRIIQFVLTEPVNRDILWQWLSLDAVGVAAGRYWKFLTYTFLHHDPLHLLGNMLLLYFAGREVEPIVGPRHFLAIFGIGNLIGGIAGWLTTPGMALVSPDRISDFAVVGVSAGVAAVLVAFTTILPELEVVVHFFFVLPLRLRAKYLAFAVVVMAAIFWIMRTAPFVGPAGMIAGAAIGWVYVKQLGFGNPLAIQRYIFEKRQRAARLDRMSPDQFISAEIDPILEKISRSGMHSLTRAERRILEQGRDKIATKTTRK
jgi:membrane associated rhomboid family serine protease